MSARFSSQGPEGPPGEPRAEQHVLVRTVHGVSLNDEFDWLKAANWREVMRDPPKLDSAIRAYLQAENDYCERALGETAAILLTAGGALNLITSVREPAAPMTLYLYNILTEYNDTTTAYGTAAVLIIAIMAITFITDWLTIRYTKKLKWL